MPASSPYRHQLLSTHPGITITKTVDGAKGEQVQVGKNYEYEVTVTNAGDVSLTNAKVADPAPAGVTFVSADQGTVANNAWNYTIPTLNVGQSMTFKITAVVNTYFEGVATNKACVDASEVPGAQTHAILQRSTCQPHRLRQQRSLSAT